MKGLFLGLAAFSLMPATSAHAVDFVRICTSYGSDFYYSPGTDVCVNAITGLTKQDTLSGTVEGKTVYRAKADQAVADAHHATTRAYDALAGTTVAAAMPSAVVDSGGNFAMSGSVSQFAGFKSVGFGGAAKVTRGLSLTGGLGSSVDNGIVGGRVGFNLSW